MKIILPFCFFISRDFLVELTWQIPIYYVNISIAYLVVHLKNIFLEVKDV